MVCLQNFYWKKCIDYQYPIQYLEYSGILRGGFGVFKPPQIPKALQNHAKLNPIVKTVKKCWI